MHKPRSRFVVPNLAILSTPPANVCPWTTRFRCSALCLSFCFRGGLCLCVMSLLHRSPGLLQRRLNQMIRRPHAIDEGKHVIVRVALAYDLYAAFVLDTR